MELRIGENIRRMRREKGMTQEQLSELLNVSCAAVSKWESSDTYPDITMLIPIARIFDISVDTLMDYSKARTEFEIESIIETYGKLGAEGKFADATEFITKARKSYPNDYRIMNIYMWDIAGGSAANNSDVLISHQDEFTQICDIILSGCLDETIRLEAMTMKAKIHHALGKTSAALEIFKQFPSWYQSSGQKTEQLFAKDTSEFRYWVRHNLYELADFTANKMIKTIWYECGITPQERVSRCEAAADLFTEIRTRSSENVFAVYEFAAFSELASKLTFSEGSIEDIIRIRSKELNVSKFLSEVVHSDEVLHDFLMATFKTEDITYWIVDWLENSPCKTLAQLRGNQDYLGMLNKNKA